jgi:hypothetical protein
MSVSYTGSQNAHHLLGLDQRVIFLLKDCRQIWKRNIDYSNFQVVGVGDNGNAVIKSDEGIIIYFPRLQDKEKVLDVFSKKHLDEQNAAIGKVMFDQYGKNICIEKITYKSRFTEKILKLLDSTKSDKGEALHELIIYELATGKQTIIHRFTVDRRISYAFSWDISPDFSHIIIGEAQKSFKGIDTEFSAFNLRDNKTYDKFVLEGLTEWILKANNHGMFFVDSPQRKDKRQILVTNINRDKFRLTVPSHYAFSHLSKGYIAFQSRIHPTFLFKRYDDTEIQEIDFSGIERLKMDYRLIFTEREDIYLLVYKGQNAKIAHTNIERLQVDTKRWQMVAEQRDIEEEINVKKEDLLKKQKLLKEKQGKQKSEEMLKAIGEFRKERSDKRLEMYNEKCEELERLKEMFRYDQIDKSDYIKYKMHIEGEMESLRLQIEEAESTSALPSQSTINLPEKIRNIPPRERQGVMSPLEESARLQKSIESISLQDELARYIPNVSMEDDSGDIRLNRAASPQGGAATDRTVDLGRSGKSDEHFFDEFEGIFDEEPSDVIEFDEEQRLEEIRKQIEMEISSAVEKKGRFIDETKQQIDVYLHLIGELEDSYKNKYISQEIYQRLHKKYSEKIAKLKEELNR